MNRELDRMRLFDFESSSQMRRVTRELHRGTPPVYVDDGPIRVLGQACVQSRGIDWSRAQFHGYQGDARKLKGFLEPDDILVNSTGTGTLGRVGHFEGSEGMSTIADSHITLIRVDRAKIEPRFLFYYLTSDVFQRHLFGELVTGATNQIELSSERMGFSPVPCPALGEQRRIVDFLDNELSRIDRLRLIRTRLLSILDERVASQARVRTGRADLGARKVPGVAIRRVTSRVKTGSTPPSMGEAEYFKEAGAGVPWYGPASFTEGLALAVAARDVSQRTIDVGVVPSFRPNSVLLVGIGATAGKVAHLNGLASGNQQITALEVNDKVVSRFLAWQLWAARDELLSLAPYTTLPIINNDFLRNFSVVVPDIAEQARVAHELDAEWIRREDLQHAAARADTLLAERRQALITAAVTGQIDVTTARGAAI